MLTLFTNAQVFAPAPLGLKQVLIAGSEILAVDDSIDIGGAEVREVNAGGRWLLPGLIDVLTHPCGGGGEGGFGNRTDEISAEAFIRAGVTSPIGALGTDAITRSLEVLFGTTMALRARGLDAFMYTGSYQVPAVTLTGNVTRDLVLIDPIIGCGEVAISDHRSSQPTIEELRRLGAETRLGGIISGKAGVVLVHVGDGTSGLAPLLEAASASDLPLETFFPTHCNRNRRLLKESFDFARLGATIDFTVSTTQEFIDDGEIPALDALLEALGSGVPAERLTLSSDAGGSLPHYVDGELKGLVAAGPESLLELLREAAQAYQDSLPAVIAALSTNPARVLGLNKGRIACGHDADLLLIDPDTLELTDVIGRGRWLLRDGHLHATA